jgi:hypothetical protein
VFDACDHAAAWQLGRSHRHLFSDDAITLIHQTSRGYPRTTIHDAPHPAPAQASAAPITTTSARRTSTLTGSNTCVTQPAQRARRGRSRHRTSPPSRTARARPFPDQPAPTGRARQPAADQPSLDLTRIHAYREHGCLRAPHRGPPGRSATRRRGPLATSTRSRCRAPGKGNPPAVATLPITPNDTTPSLHDHRERRTTGVWPRMEGNDNTIGIRRTRGRA